MIHDCSTCGDTSCPGCGDEDIAEEIDIEEEAVETSDEEEPSEENEDEEET